MVWKLCGKVQFPHGFGQFAQNYAETVTFQKISTPGNYGILRCAHCVKTIQNQTVKINFVVSVLSSNTAKYRPKNTWDSKTFYTMDQCP